MQTNKFVRKPFEVEAAQVTAENISEVAEWCGGTVETTAASEKRPAEQYVQVKVHRPLNERQTKAFVGDHVLFAGTGYKVYTPKAFENCFEPKHEQLEIGEAPLVELMTVNEPAAV